MSFMMLLYSVAAVAFVVTIAMKVAENNPETQIVPEAFEAHHHEEVEEINPSESPFGWWKKTVKDHLK